MLIELQDVSYVYGKDTVYEVRALDHINLKIEEGQFIGVIGHTGSGKSTLIQHLNGLIRPTEGKVLFEGRDIWAAGYDLRSLRTHVGLVFQYPENQLFETDVLSDVEFGPKNEGLSKDEMEARAVTALKQVGVPEELYKVSPFELSGGQKRRVAIAGVLAMDPQVLILDEPTAGLDPQGRDEILDRIKYLHDKRGITILLVSHSMEDVANYADRLLVVNEGKIPFDGKPKDVFFTIRSLRRSGSPLRRSPTSCMLCVKRAWMSTLPPRPSTKHAAVSFSPCPDFTLGTVPKELRQRKVLRNERYQS